MGTNGSKRDTSTQRREWIVTLELIVSLINDPRTRGQKLGELQARSTIHVDNRRYFLHDGRNYLVLAASKSNPASDLKLREEGAFNIIFTKSTVLHINVISNSKINEISPIIIGKKGIVLSNLPHAPTAKNWEELLTSFKSLRSLRYIGVLESLFGDE